MRLSASLQEKRVLLDLVSIRETCGGNLESSSSVRWVPSSSQLADGLTKRDRQLRDNLAAFCMRPRLSLTAEAVAEERSMSSPQMSHDVASVATRLGVAPRRPLA